MDNINNCNNYNNYYNKKTKVEIVATQNQQNTLEPENYTAMLKPETIEILRKSFGTVTVLDPKLALPLKVWYPCVKHPETGNTIIASSGFGTEVCSNYTKASFLESKQGSCFHQRMAGKLNDAGVNQVISFDKHHLLIEEAAINHFSPSIQISSYLPGSDTSLLVEDWHSATVTQLQEFVRGAIDFLTDNDHNKTMLVHCWGGTGRTPQFIAALRMALFKESPEEAIAFLRREMSHEAIEIPSQYVALKDFARTIDFSSVDNKSSNKSIQIPQFHPGHKGKGTTKNIAFESKLKLKYIEQSNDPYENREQYKAACSLPRKNQNQAEIHMLKGYVVGDIIKQCFALSPNDAKWLLDSFKAGLKISKIPEKEQFNGIFNGCNAMYKNGSIPDDAGYKTIRNVLLLVSKSN